MRGFVRSRGFIARELNVGSALCIFYGAGSDRRTIYIYIYIYIWIANSRTVYVGLAQARPNYMSVKCNLDEKR